MATLTAKQIEEQIDKVMAVAQNVQQEKSCDSDCQAQRTLDALKTNLDETKNSCDNYAELHKQYTIQKFGVSGYNQMESEKNNVLLQKQNEELIKSFIEKITKTTIQFDKLQNDVNNLKLMQEMHENSGFNKSLNDVFGITISPFEGFTVEKNRTLETINQEIKFSYKKNEIGKFINKILYIIFYILASLIILYMFSYKKNDIKYRIVISIIILFLPLVNIVKFVVYLFTILKSFI